MADDVDEDRDSDVEIIEIEKCDPRLDFFSDRFDPLLALRTPDVEVLDSTAKVFDNLAAYRAHADNKTNPRNNAKTKLNKNASDGTTIQRRWKEHQLPTKKRDVKIVKNLWSRMEAMQGPLSLLQRCIQEKLRIKVWTRDDRRIRGYCLAYLVAFDKFWNMALEDVTECWTRLKKRKVPAFESVQHKRIETIARPSARHEARPPKISVTPHLTDNKLENCSRYVHQLMIRGEQVVFVNVVEEKNDREDVNLDAKNPEK